MLLSWPLILHKVHESVFNIQNRNCSYSLDTGREVAFLKAIGHVPPSQSMHIKKVWLAQS